MYKLFLGFMGVVLFVGCSSKEEQDLMKSYAQKTQYHKYLQKTEKTELMDGDKTVAILTATYLYTRNFKKIDERDEVFIVGVAFDDPEANAINFDKTSTTANEEEFTLTVNNKTATKVVRLDKNDKRLKDISFVTDWGEYYEVTYPNVGKRFSLVFENTLYGKGTMHFSKVAKFTYTKKGF